MNRFVASLALALTIPGCSGESAAPPTAPRDPQVAAAYDDPLMADPDLSARNEAAAAVRIVTDAALPVLPATPEAIAAARAEAAALVGGAEHLRPLPAPAQPFAPLARDAKLVGHIAALPPPRGCEARLTATAAWAARMPNALPVYPRGAVERAGGRDEPGCRLRAVAFTTPVPADEVSAFYARRARSAGMTAVHYSDGDGAVLRGEGGGIVYDVRIARAPEGTAVRIAAASR